MNQSKMFDRLVDNALDFLKMSINQLDKYPKYSLINFYSSIELFLKARLMAEHWSLIVTKNQEPDWGKFVSGDFRSVTLKDAANRLEKIVKSGLSKNEFETFDMVSKHRNKLVHFFHDENIIDDLKLKHKIVSQQLSAWYFLHNLLTIRWKNIFSKWSSQISEIDKSLRKLQLFLKVVFENLSGEIESLKNEGIKFRICPSCGFEAQHIDYITDAFYNSNCKVCRLEQSIVEIVCPDCNSPVIFENEGFTSCQNCGKIFEPINLADIMEDESEVYLAKKDGDDSWDRANCYYCDGYHTVIRIGEDGYFCASCFDISETVEQCEWCSEPNNGSMEDTFWHGCTHCEGKEGWSKDD